VKQAALYARVSTDQQDETMQVHEMRRDCERRDLFPTIFTDTGQSGSKERRPGLDRMMGEVRKGKFDVVMVYKFDRFARSLRQLLDALEEFRIRGVDFISVHESIDTTMPAGRLMFQMVGAFAEFERELIRERVKSGIAHVRSKGARWGRPSKQLDAAEIARLRKQQGLSWAEVAQAMGASKASCQRAILRASKTSSEMPV
jgi:DNA invertase Pin-like site-specific DNA recombinase